MMAAIQSLGLLVLLSSFCNGQLTVNVTLTKTVVNIGESVTLTCDIWQSRNTLEPLVVTTFKKIGDVKYGLGRNSDVYPSFRETGRYHQIFQQIRTTNRLMKKYVLTLQINDVQASDSAVFGCMLPRYRVEVYKRLVVYSPVQRIQLTMGDPMGNEFKHRAHGQTLQLPEGKIQTVVCWVKGGYPAPKVVLTVANHDITNQFQRRQDLVTDGEIPGQQVLQYRTSLLNKAFNITKALDDKVLRCAATIPGSDFGELSEWMKIQLAENEPANEILEDLQNV